jgi:pyruvate kinase
MGINNKPDQAGESNMLQRRSTRIIATLGPSTDMEGVLEGIIQAGVNVCRINMSHGTQEEQARRARQVRDVSRALGKEVAIMADLKGPKVRIGTFRDGSVVLGQGDPFILDAGEPDKPGNPTRVGVSYAGLPDDVEPGTLLLLDDGLMSMRVTEVQDARVICEVENGGILSGRKGLNIKGGGLSIPGIADHDPPDIKHAAEMGVDYLAVSFPRNAEDMNEARRMLREAGSNARLVSKIERVEAIENLEEIIDASHAVLVARGDLGVEIGDAELPAYQKQIIDKALNQNRIVVTATQMMQSMIESPIPTRAEVLDVANAVIDGTDAVMLSAETAVGQHPVTVVEAMHRVCVGAEKHCAAVGGTRQLNVRFQRIDQALAMAAMFMATNVSVQAIVAFTESGSTAQWLSRVRTGVPIFAMTRNAASRRRMGMYRDVYPISHDPTAVDIEGVAREGVQALWKDGYIKSGDRILITMGDRLGNQGGTNTLRLIQVGPDGDTEHQSALDLR